MKINKIIKWFTFAATGLMLPLLGGHAHAQNTNVTLWTFANDGTGASDLADSVAAFSWGGSTATFDPNQDANNNTNFGSLYITANSTVNQNMVIVSMFYPNSHPETGSHIYWTSNPEDLTMFTNIEFDIKWDNTNSTRNITDFNSPPNPYGDQGFKLQSIDSNNNWVLLTNVYLPSAVTNGWVHMNIPINPTISDISGSIGFALQKYVNDPNFGQAAFWLENFKLDALQVPLAPPTVKALAKPAKGLNTVASSAGQYDRHIARLLPNTGKSWVGHATSANPVTYSFTISSFPPNFYYSAETLMFLIPNPTQNEAGAPDYNEANCVQIFVQADSATQSSLNLQYKVNDADDNNMYNGGTQTVTVSGVSTNYIFYTNAPGSMPGGPVVGSVISPGMTNFIAENGNLGSVTYAGTPVGTWTVEFTSDTSGTLIAPDGTSSGFTFPAYNAATFAESSGFNVYFGMQPNATAAIGTSVVYSNFAVSNTVTPWFDNFQLDTVLSTNLDIAMSPANSVILVPATAAYDVTWTLPANGFGLNISTNLTMLSAGTSPSIYPVINGSGTVSQFVDQSELPPGNVAFFSLIKRSFTQLQVLLPGETNAPNTTLGYVGTPTPQSINSITPITINAVDSTFHIVSGVSDSIKITSSDSSAYLPNNPTLVNGTVTTPSDDTGFQFQTEPATSTITATDTTNPNISPMTSAPVSVGP